MMDILTTLHVQQWNFLDFEIIFKAFTQVSKL
jgi:hypothetical protein